MKDQQLVQRELCTQYGAEFTPAPLHMKVGIALNVRQHIEPLNGFREMSEGDTTGWYIWAGEELSTAPDFFLPLCVKHLDKWCPAVMKYLGLPPGSRFLVADGCEDVWFDPVLSSHRD